MDVETRYVRAFLAAVDEGSFTAAGQLLGLSQASISRSVAAMERAVGAPLLDRTTRRMALTSTGQAVLPHARRLQLEADAILRVRDRRRDEVRVGYAWAALGAHTTEAVARFGQRHPGSTLRFVQTISPTAGLAEGAADVAVVRRHLDDPRYEQAMVGAEPRVVALSREDPLAGRPALSLDDLSARTIAIDAATGTTGLDLWPPGARPPATEDVHGVDEWLTLIATGAAVGITPEATAGQHRKAGVVYRPLRGAQPVPVLLMWRRDDPPAALADLLALACELYGPSPTLATAGAGDGVVA